MSIHPYRPPDTEQGEDTQTPPLHYYTDQDFLIETDTYVLKAFWTTNPKNNVEAAKRVASKIQRLP